MHYGEADEAKHKTADGGHGHSSDGIQFHHGAQPLARSDIEQQLMHQLRGLGHQPDQHAGAAANEGGQHDQPEFVRADQRAQGLRRVQHGIAETAARTMVAGGRGSPGVRGCGSAREA